MHGLVNRAFQCFLQETYGLRVWEDVAQDARIPLAGFEALYHYDDALTRDMIAAAERRLGRPAETILEDMGTFLVSHAHTEALRRLLRFGGTSFVDFLHSLDDLPRRARLAVADLDFPDLEVRDGADGVFRIRCKPAGEGFGHVLLGVLRTLADDYGTLVLLEHVGVVDDAEEINVRVLNTEHAEGRRFQLAAGM